MKEIIRAISGYVILWTLLQEMVTQKELKQYLRLIGSLLLMILVLQKVFIMEEMLPNLLEHYYERTFLQADEEEKEELIQEYKESLELQLQERIEEQGFEVESIIFSLEQTEIEQIEIRVKEMEEYDKLQMKKEISRVYYIEETHIIIES